MDLQGRLILVTRPLPEGEVFAEMVRRHHGQALPCPTLVIHPPPDPAAFAQAMARVAEYDGLILTSANAARALLDALPEGAALPPLHAVGPKTARVLEAAGHHPRIPSGEFSGAGLAQAILALRDGAPGRFLFPRAEIGREELAERLIAAGCEVNVVTAYRAEAVAALPEAALTALRQGAVAAIPFFSGRTAQAFVAALPPEGRAWLHGVALVAVSPVTARVMTGLGLEVAAVAATATAEGVLACLAREGPGPRVTPGEHGGR